MVVLDGVGSLVGVTGLLVDGSMMWTDGAVVVVVVVGGGGGNSAQ